MHGGFHEPSATDKRRAEIKRTEQRIASMEGQLVDFKRSNDAVSRRMARTVKRQLADARAYLEHLEGDSGN